MVFSSYSHCCWIKNMPFCKDQTKKVFLSELFWVIFKRSKRTEYSKVSNKRTVFNNRTGGDIILQKV